MIQVETHPSQISLSEIYSFRSELDVIAWLREYAFLIPLLSEAVSVIEHCFGRDAQVTLEVVADPEDGDRQLFGLFQIQSSAERAMAQLDRFDSEWWLQASLRSQHRMNFCLEFV